MDIKDHPPGWMIWVNIGLLLLAMAELYVIHRWHVTWRGLFHG